LDALAADHNPDGEGRQGYPTDTAMAVARRMSDSSRGSGNSSLPEDIEDLPGLSDAQHTTSIDPALLQNLTSDNGVNTIAVEELGSIAEESRPQTGLPTCESAAAPVDSQQQLEQPAKLVRNVSEGISSIAADQTEAKTSATLPTQQPAAVQRNVSGESSGVSSIAVEEIGLIAEETEPKVELRSSAAAQTAVPRKLSDSSGDSSVAAAELSALAITSRQPPAASSETPAAPLAAPTAPSAPSRAQPGTDSSSEYESSEYESYEEDSEEDEAAEGRDAEIVVANMDSTESVARATRPIDTE